MKEKMKKRAERGNYVCIFLHVSLGSGRYGDRSSTLISAVSTGCDGNSSLPLAGVDVEGFFQP